MDKPVIKSAYFKRALLFLCGSGKCDAIAFVCTSKNLTFYPMYIENNADEFTACFDLASGLGGKPLPTAAWALRFDGNTELQFDGERDFSDNGGIYTVALICDELGVNLFSKCSPTHVGIKLKIADIALNTVFKISQIAAKTGAQKGCRVLFTSMSRASLSGNEKYVYDEIMRRDELKKKLDIQFALSDKGGIGFYLKTAWSLGKSNVIILDDYHPLVYRFNYRDDVKVAQLWHACGAFKTFGYSRLGKEGAPRFDGHSHRCYTHAFVSGDGVRKYYAEAFGIPLSKVYATGVPRTDDMAAVKRTEKGSNEPFTILFAPTFRGNGANSANYPYDKLDLEKLSQLCRRENMRVIFKMHPFIKQRVPIDDSMRDVLTDESDKREINDILPCCDLLITDYSSVIYEASLLNIPMLFYTFDLDEYISSRDFYEPFEQFVPGKIVMNFDSLINAIENREFNSDTSKTFKDRNFSGEIGHSSAHVVDVLFYEIQAKCE